MLMIDHAGGWHTSYYHVIDEQVTNGQSVSAGQWIADVGEATPCGGSATANHVHFSLWYYIGAFSWGAKASEAFPLDGVDIGGWTIHQGSSNYLGSWTRDSDGYTYNVPPSGYMSCGCVNNTGPAAPSGPVSITAANNGGQMSVQLVNFPTGVSYYFCHTGDPSTYPTGGSVPNHGQVTVTSPNQSWSSGLCSGSGNFWIGIQASDGNSYYSNQVTLGNAPPSITAGNDSGQMTVQLANFPTGVSYYFCHTGDASGYPTGGSVPNHGQITVSTSNQSWSSGLCAGSGNFWIGIQATDGNSYYSNQTVLGAPSPTPSSSNPPTPQPTPTDTSTPVPTRLPTQVEISVSPPRIRHGSRSTLVAIDLPRDATGYATFAAASGTRLCRVVVSGGHGSCRTSTHLRAGVYHVAVHYGGDSTYGPSTSGRVRLVVT